MRRRTHVQFAHDVAMNMVSGTYVAIHTHALYIVELYVVVHMHTLNTYTNNVVLTHKKKQETTIILCHLYRIH